MGKSDSFAVIGASCRLPGAENLQAFADMLRAGRSAVTEMPGNRWTKARYFHPVQGQPGKTYSFAAGALADVFAFDASCFGISPREAASIDPQQRLMLELANDAMEDAGLLPSRLSGSDTGVFIGASSWDFAASAFSDAAALDAYSMQGAALSSVSNRISYVFGLRGPSLTVDTACSSSLVALHLACEALRRGDVGLAIAGGVNLLIAPQAFVGFARASMLSRLGRCHAFDARADGYVRGEGGGALIVKTLPRALQDGDQIRAVIRGIGVNSDGRTSSFSVPSAAAQTALMREVSDRAGVAADDFSYFEAHGTGTPVGDPIEARAIGDAIGRYRRDKLPIGSVKTNIGHLEPASGIAGLIKLLVAFEHGVIPPSLNFETPNPNIPFATLNLEVVSAARPLGALALAGINSFGFGGTNAHAILSAPPPRAQPPADAGDGVIGMPLLLSGRSSDALRALAATWVDTLNTTRAAAVPALLRGSARHRQHFAHRMVVSGQTPDALSGTLQAWIAGAPAESATAGQTAAGDLAFIYSGNGSQWAGMGRDALRHNATFRAAMADLDERLGHELGWSVTGRLGADDLAEHLRHTEVAQPLLFAIQVAAVATLRSFGLTPAAHAGHSAGEVAAAVGSGALSLDQGCHVIIQRSLLQGATRGSGGMATLAMSPSAAEALIARIGVPLAVAAMNGAEAVTIAGPVAALADLEDAVSGAGAQLNRLDLDYAFHTPLMEPIRLRLLAALDGLSSAAPTEAMISTVTGKPVGAGELDAAYWWRNVRQPVRFDAAVDGLIRSGVRNFLEIGPQPVLQSYLLAALRNAGESGRVIATLSSRKTGGDALATAAAECHVAGADISAAACFDGFAELRGLPHYPYQRTRCAPSRTTERVEANAPIHDHPLLGFRDPSSRDSWMSHLCTAWEPWLADHVVDGTVVLPAAAIIDMALAAARISYPEAASLEIQDLEITRELALEANAERDCRTTVTSDGYLELASRPRLSPEAVHAHAKCRIIPGLGTRPILDVVAAGHAGIVDAPTIYARAEAMHLHYGPAFRTVVQVHRHSATQAMAELAAADGQRMAAGYLLDPPVLDGSFHALLALVAGDPGTRLPGVIVPWRFGRIRLLAQGLPQPWQASLHVRHVGPRSICADIALSDRHGDTVAELIDCWFAVMPAAQRAAADANFWTAYVPSLSQPPAPLPDPSSRVIAAVNGVEDVPDTVLLADACASAIAYEALLALTRDDGLPAAVTALPLAATALTWLAEDGLAACDANGWRLAGTSDLPDAGEIWRSLMFGSGDSAAECAMLAALGPALANGGKAALRLSPVLLDQALFASPSAHAALKALWRGVEAITATWPSGRCLRVAAVGALHGRLLGRLLLRIGARGLPFRLVAVASNLETLPGIREVLAQTPGASAELWTALPDETWNGFDLVLDLYGLSLSALDRLRPDQILRLLAPTGGLLAVEPVPGHAAELLFGPGIGSDTTAGLRHPDEWCAALRDAGFATARETLLDGSVWHSALLVATAPAEFVPVHGRQPCEQAGLVVFAAPNDPLAAALAARQSMLRLLPIETMRDVLAGPFAARQQHVLLLASAAVDEDAFVETLAELLADISTTLQSIAAPQSARLWLVAEESPTAYLTSAALTGLRRVAANELPLLDCRVISFDAALSDAEIAGHVLRELAAPDQEAEVLWRPGGRLVPRLRTGVPATPLADGTRRLEVARPGLIGSLAWVNCDVRPPGPGEVAIEVHAAALNFRDVMWAQGLLPDEALLAGFSGPSLGLECAGVVTATGEGVDDLRPGDRVAAVAPAALATRVVTRRNGVMRVPPGVPFAAAATIPVAFTTAVYALGHLARLEAGETVLIHSGAGAVGLAAIQYALHKGAIVYATAGSAMRRQTLHMLGVTAAFDSRSTGFVDDILSVTGGKGVDVVLNSVSQELMKQSLRLLKPFGRFLEIGKRDLYRDTPIGIRPLRHNVSYFAIDVDELMAHRPETAFRVIGEIAELLAAEELRPLPYRTFGFSDAVAAFRLLQSSGHIGKVVLLPEPTPAAEKPAEVKLRADGVYVITGGLTGFGLETARWMARRGAGAVALVSRRGGLTPGSDRILAELGCNARVFACDVAEPAALQVTLDEIRAGMGPIRGVIHAAMVLDDGLLHDLDATRFAAVIRPKIAGALALDKLTRDDPLELFVLFSSVTTVIGTPGQASYLAANRMLEALAERRHEAGLPALAVQWGPIGDAGYLVNEARISEMLAAMLGSAHLPAAQALEALPALLASGRPVAGLANVAWGGLHGRLPGLDGLFWSEMPARDFGSPDGQSRVARLAGMTPQEAGGAVRAVLVEEIARVLQQPASTIGLKQPIHEFGVDSLMAVELQTAVEMRLGLQVPLMSLTGASTVSAIADKLLDFRETGGLANQEDDLTASIMRHEAGMSPADPVIPVPSHPA